MFYWIYDLPTWQLVVMASVSLVAFSWFGAIFIRPILHLFIPRQAGLNEVVGYMLGAHSAFFGILLGLLALSAYQNYTQADGIVALEASKLGALYRDVSSYPEPTRSELQTLLRDYTRYVIDEAWPEQQKGIVPRGGNIRTARFQDRLLQFEPKTKNQEIIHAETLRQFNTFVETRRLRLNAVVSAIPAILWFVVFLGVGINVLLIWLLKMRIFAQLFYGGISAFFLASLVSLVAAMDYPFRGEVSISADAFRLIYDQLMDPNPAVNGSNP
jgi:hypothetical protein